MGKLAKHQKLHYNEQVKFYYQANNCKGNDYLCEQDDSIDLNVRFYEINVIATDWAGHVGSDTCTVIMVPHCNSHDEGCELSEGSPYKHHYKRDYLLNIIEQSDSRYYVASIKTEWKSDLLTLTNRSFVQAKTREPSHLRSS